jgi:hypothetical protein
MNTKKIYEAPRLLGYGSIAERTQFYAGGCEPLDPSGGCPPKSQTGPCHLDFANEWSCSS